MYRLKKKKKNPYASIITHINFSELGIQHTVRTHIGAIPSALYSSVVVP